MSDIPVYPVCQCLTQAGLSSYRTLPMHIRPLFQAPVVIVYLRPGGYQQARDRRKMAQGTHNIVEVAAAFADNNPGKISSGCL